MLKMSWPRGPDAGNSPTTTTAILLTQFPQSFQKNKQKKINQLKENTFFPCLRFVFLSFFFLFVAKKLLLCANKKKICTK